MSSRRTVPVLVHFIWPRLALRITAASLTAKYEHLDALDVA